MMSCHCLFVSDLHGSELRFRRLWRTAEVERPAAILLGGDLLPGFAAAGDFEAFVADVLENEARSLQNRFTSDCPAILMIPGNDDPAASFEALQQGQDEGLWQVIHRRRDRVGEHAIYGYACVPPTPFMLKDWERYDVSRFVDPGCISPANGQRTTAFDGDDIQFGTIAGDIGDLTGEDDQDQAVWLFHSPPYRTALDRASLDGQFIDHVPLDVHVGSIAIQRFIEEKQPLLTLHGHVHEAPRLTGHWKEKLGRTWMLSAAHDGPELALVRVDLDNPGAATRELL